MVPSPGGISPVTLGRPSAGPNRLAHCPTRRSRPGCWPCRQGREKIPETLPRKRAGRTGRRSQGSRTLIRQWTLYRCVGAQGQLRDPDHRHGARPGGARSRPARAGARADKYRTRVTFIGRDSSGPPRHNLRTRTWVAARNHRRITAPRTRTFNHGAALVVTGRIPDFPVTRSHPPASWPSAANSSICRTYRKTAGEESRRRSPVANRWMRP